MKRRRGVVALCILAVGVLASAVGAEQRVLEVTAPSATFQKLVSDSRPAESKTAREEVLGANRVLNDVDVRQDGDRVTLSFLPAVRGAPARFFLVGSKRDFLLLALSGDPQEALERLSGLDPAIRSAQATRSGPQLTLRLTYESAGADGSAGRGEATGAQTDDQVFAAARGREEALETYLQRFPSGQHAADAQQELEALRSARMEAEYEAVLATGDPKALQDFMDRWAGGPKAGRNGKEMRLHVRGPTTPSPAESPAQPPRAPEPAPPAPSAEERAEAPYRAALSQGTVEALAQFVAAFPDAPQTTAARLRMAELRQEAAYRVAAAENTVSAFRGFVAIFPDSPRRAEAEARIRALEAERVTAETQRKARDTERKAQEAERERRARAYEEAQRLDAPEAYRMVLATYPNSEEARGAEKRLREIEADERAYEEAHGTESGLERYLSERPKGRFAADARERLAQLRTVRMEAEFQSARAAGSAEALQAFLDRWPKSARVPQAKEQLVALRKEEAERAAVAAKAAEKPPEPAPPPTLRLAVRAVASGPRVDGAEDRLWRDVPVLDVPVAGPRGKGIVRLRAVHDGSVIYFLAEWADRSRDETYRPWVWNQGAASYQQVKDLDDALALSLYRGETDSALSSCMLGGESIDADLWLWRAGWGALSSLADDGRLRVSRERIPQSNPYPVRSGQGQVWIRQDWDEGMPGWSLFIPVERAGDRIPSYRATPARGSRGDVRAAGAWVDENGGLWRVEFARALDTGHPDDVPVALGKTQVAAVATYDKADRADHSSSPPIFLDVRSR